LKPPPEAISAIAREQKKPEERREGTRARSGPKGLALDALAASGNGAGAMDGEAVILPHFFFQLRQIVC
jgi:hypothetical protein